VQYSVTPGAGHDDVILDKMFGYKGKSGGTELMEDYIAKSLEASD
jgi:hypothetical protein